MGCQVTGSPSYPVRSDLALSKSALASKGNRRTATTHCCADADKAEDHHAPSCHFGNGRGEADVAAISSSALGLTANRDRVRPCRKQLTRGRSRAERAEVAYHACDAVNEDRGEIDIAHAIDHASEVDDATRTNAILRQDEVEGIREARENVARTRKRVADGCVDRARVAGADTRRRNVKIRARRGATVGVTSNVGIGSLSAHDGGGHCGHDCERFPHRAFPSKCDERSLGPLGDASQFVVTMSLILCLAFSLAVLIILLRCEMAIQKPPLSIKALIYRH